jgi:hypothetical protein
MPTGKGRPLIKPGKVITANLRQAEANVGGRYANKEVDKLRNANRKLNTELLDRGLANREAGSSGWNNQVKPTKPRKK